MGLLRTLAILVISYYVFKFFSRYIAPIFLRKVMKNVEKKFREQQQQQQQQPEESKAKVGETVIEKKPRKIKQSNKDAGDYVDYEDVND